MTSDLLVLATSIGIGAGLVLTAAMSVRLARLARTARRPATTTAAALAASVALTGACVAVAAALLVRVPIEPAAPEPPATRPSPARARIRDAAAGRRPAIDASRLGDAQDLVWPLVRLRIRVPRDWIVRTLSPT